MDFIRGYMGRSGVTDEGQALTPIRKDTLGLRIVTPQTQDADVDIVAVHGLGGDAFDTWTSPDGHFWLQDSLPQALKSPPAEFELGAEASKVARVMTFGYDAHVFTKSSSQRSFLFAESLLSDLKDRRSGAAAHRPLIFLGHSLGGIVIKKALNLAHSRPAQWGDLLASVRHVCFFGTPHQGTNDSTAQFLLNLCHRLTGRKSGSLWEELKQWSPQLTETNQCWVELANEFTITTFIEGHPYKHVMVVPEGSARMYRDNERVITMDADHLSICKFSSDDEMLRKVLGRLCNVVAAMGTTVRVEELEQLLEIRQEHDQILLWMSTLTGQQPSPEQSDRFEPERMRSVLKDAHFQRCLEKDAATLLLVGDLGTGKTSTVNGMKQHLEREGSVNVAVAFFHASEPDCQSWPLIAMHLLSQLCSSSSSMCERVRSLYKETKPNFNPSSQDMIEALVDVIGEREKHCIIVDALDECLQMDHLITVLTELEKLQKRTKVGIILTDRTSGNVKRADFTNVGELRLVPHEKDTTNYIKSRLRGTSIGTAFAECPDLMVDATDAISRASGGLFLMTVLHTEYIISFVSRPTIQQSIKVIRGSCNDKGQYAGQVIETAFRRNIERSLRPDSEWSNERAYLAEKILRFVRDARRPFTDRELRHAIQEEEEFRTGDECLDPGNDLASLCLGLVKVDKDDRVRFVHGSLQEYLTRVWQDKLPPCHLNLTNACLLYLSRDGFASGWCKNKLALADRRRKFPFVDYAARYWVHHFEEYFDNPISARSSHDGVEAKALSLLRDRLKVQSFWQIIKLPEPTSATALERPRDRDQAARLTFLIEERSSKIVPYEPKDFSGLHLVCHFNCTHLLTLLEPLLAGSSDLFSKDGGGDQPIHVAASSGNPDLLRSILDAGADPHARNSEGNQPIHRASSSASADLLLAPHAKNGTGDQPVHYAASSGNADLLRTVIAAGGDPDARNGMNASPLSLAVSSGNLESVQVLLRNRDRIRVNAKTFQPDTSRVHEISMSADAGSYSHGIRSWSSGRTALHNASRNGRLDLVELLCSFDELDASILDREGMTAFHKAAKYGHTAVLKHLQGRSDVDHLRLSDDGRTAMHLAAKYGHEEAFAYLVSLPSAPWELPDRNDCTVEDYIVIGNKDEAKAKQLLSYKFTQDDSGQHAKESARKLYESKAKRLLQPVHQHVDNSASAVRQSSNQEAPNITILIPFKPPRQDKSAPSTPVPRDHPSVRGRRYSNIDDNFEAKELSRRLKSLR